MYEFTEKENKTANNILALSIVYIVLSLIQEINWHEVLIKESPSCFETFSAAVNVADTGLNIARNIIVILIFFFIKKLRQTDKTKKLYGIVFWIMTGSAIFSYLYTGLFYIANFLSWDIIRVLREKYLLMSSINFVYLYLGIFLPIPFYIAILIKEKSDINWMIIGRLTSVYLFLIGKIIYGIRDYMRSDIRYMMDFSFEQRLPLLSFYINYDALVAIRSYFWIVGVLAVVFIYKKRFSLHRAKESA
jgi:hypothetical protein